MKSLIKLCVPPLQVLCPCAKRRERRDQAGPLDDPLDDSDTNTLGLSAQDLRDPAAIVSIQIMILFFFVLFVSFCFGVFFQCLSSIIINAFLC